jgi:hypothetical protein
MTPDQYLKALSSLVGQGRAHDAIAFADRHWPRLAPEATGDEFVRISRLMEIAETILDVRQPAARNGATSASSGQSSMSAVAGGER